MRGFYDLLLRARWPVLAGLLALTAWLGTYLWPPEDLKTDFSFEALFVASEDEQAALRHYQRTFGDEGAAVTTVVIMPPPDDAPVDTLPRDLSQTVFAPRVVDAVATLDAWLRGQRAIDAERVVALPGVPSLHGGVIAPDLLARARDRLARRAEAAGIAPDDALARQARGSPLPDEVADAAHAYSDVVETLLAHDLYAGRLVSRDGRATAVVATFDADDSDPATRAALIDALKTQVATLRASLPAGAEVHVTGAPVIQQAYSTIALSDLKSFVPITALVIALLLWFAFRSPFGVVAPMAGVAMATIWGLGLMQRAGEPINLINNVMGVVVLVIGVADGIHVLARYHQIAPDAASKREAILETMVRMTPACLVTSLTTAVGFGSLVTATVPTLRSFGAYVAATIMMAFVAQMLLMPIALSLVRRPRARHFHDPRRSRSGRALLWTAERVERHRRGVIVVTLVVVVAAGLGIAQVDDDAHALDELAESHPVSQALRATERHLTGVLVHAVTFRGRAYPEATCTSDADCARPGCDPAACERPGCCSTRVCRKTAGSGDAGEGYAEADAWDDEGEDVVIIDGEDAPSAPTPGPEGVCVESVDDPSFVRAVADLDRWLSGAPEHRALVGDVASLADLVREVWRGFADDPQAQLPGDLDRATIHQLLGLLAGGRGDTLARHMSRDRTESHLTIYARDAGTHAWQRLRPELAAELERRFEDDPRLSGRYDLAITGSATLTQAALERTIGDMARSIVWAFSCIAALLALLLRSVRVAVISLAPNALPLACTLATMGYFGVSVRVSTVIVFSVALGIAVDDTVHFLYRFRSELLAGRDLSAATRATTLHTGRAIVLTTAVLVLGFAVTAMSDFVALQQFGILAGLTLLWAVVADVVVLPAMCLVLRLDRALLGGRARAPGSV